MAKDHFGSGSGKGFTFIEVLVAISLLSVGIVAIFRIFFGSVSTMEHIKNRFDAHFFIEEKKWQLDDAIRRKIISQAYTDRDITETIPQFTVISRIQKNTEPIDFYIAEITATWKENNKDMMVQRRIYLQ